MEVLGSDNGFNVNQFTQILPKIVGFYSSCLHGIKTKNNFFILGDVFLVRLSKTIPVLKGLTCII